MSGFWRISGIERDIYMYARPQIHLTDFKAETPLDGDYRNGILKLKVKFANKTDNEVPFVVGYRLLDSKDRQIAQSSTRVGHGQTEVEFTPKTIEAPLQWTAETPDLYTLVISLNAYQRRCYRGHQLQSRFPYRRDKGQATDGKRQTYPRERRQLSRA